MEKLKQIWNKAYKFLGIIGVVIVTVVVTRWLSPSQVVEKPVIVKDDAEIARVQKEYESKLKAQDGIISSLKRTLGLVVSPQPSIAYGKIERPIKFEIYEDTVHSTKYYVAGYDFPLYGKALNDEVSFYTTNPYLEVLGLDSRKIYKWPRKARNFYFSLSPTKSSTANSIYMEFERDAFRYGGTFAGLGADFKGAYLWLDVRFDIFEIVDITLYANTSYGLGVRAGFEL